MNELYPICLDTDTGEQHIAKDGDKIRGVLNRLDANYTAVGNVGAGEDDLITYTTYPDTLDRFGDEIKIIAYGVFGATANTKRVRAYRGSTLLIDSGTQSQSGGSWFIEAHIVSTGVGTQNCITTFSTDTVLFTNIATYSAGTEDETTAIVIKCTGEGVANDDIVQKGMQTYQMC